MPSSRVSDLYIEVKPRVGSGQTITQYIEDGDTIDTIYSDGLPPDYPIPGIDPPDPIIPDPDTVDKYSWVTIDNNEYIPASTAVYNPIPISAIQDAVVYRGTVLFKPDRSPDEIDSYSDWVIYTSLSDRNWSTTYTRSNFNEPFLIEFNNPIVLYNLWCIGRVIWFAGSTARISMKFYIVLIDRLNTKRVLPASGLIGNSSDQTKPDRAANISFRCQHVTDPNIPIMKDVKKIFFYSVDDGMSMITEFLVNISNFSLD